MSLRTVPDVRWLVLSALATGSRDASELIADVGVISGGQARLRAGTLFTTLWRLRSDRLIAVDREEIVDRRLRRYYHLTLAGQERLAASGGHTPPEHSSVAMTIPITEVILMSATLHLSRPFRLADAAWPYEIVVDGQAAGVIRNRASAGLAVAAGTHALQIRSLHVVNRRLGLASPTVTSAVGDGETAEFVCHPRPFLPSLFWWIACLVGDRSRWIVLSQANPNRQAGAK